MEKEWKTIKGYDDYKISNYGDIYSLKSGRLLKCSLNKHNGYLYINIYKDTVSKSFRVHKLVARHFISEPPQHNSVVGHLDNNKQNNFVGNLYWTTTKDNTQKASDDGLIIQKFGIDNSQSKCVAVYDKLTKELVGVYGSLRECCRNIKNLELYSLAKTIKETWYKPRSKKYVYINVDKNFIKANSHVFCVKLIENENTDKKPKVFIMSNIEKEYREIFDNQTKASVVCNISQATISHLIKSNGTKDGWSFELIDSIDYKQASSYECFISKCAKFTKATNIITNEIKIFNTREELKDYFGLNGNSLDGYLDGTLLFSEWKVEDCDM